MTFEEAVSKSFEKKEADGRVAEVMPVELEYSPRSGRRWPIGIISSAISIGASTSAAAALAFAWSEIAGPGRSLEAVAGFAVVFVFVVAPLSGIGILSAAVSWFARDRARALIVFASVMAGIELLFWGWWLTLVLCHLLA